MRPIHTTTLLSLLACASCSLPQLEIAPRYSQLSLDGDFGIAAGPLAANADLDALGLDDSEGSPGLRADFSFIGAHIIASTSQMEFSGKGTLDAALSQGGITIPVGASVNSDLDLSLHSAYMLWDIFPGDTIEVAAGIGVSLLDFQMNITDSGTGFNINADETLPIPLLAANVSIDLGEVEASLLVGGFSISSGDNSGSFLDLDASLRYRLIGGQNHIRTSIIAGWRELAIELDYGDGGDSIEGDINISGPYLAFEIAL